MHSEVKQHHVVLDLDGTIVFPEVAEIAVPGRSRPTYMARRTAEALQAIGECCYVTIATARSAQSVRGLLDQLPDFQLFGLVSECGLVARRSEHTPQHLSSDRDRLLDLITNKLPGWQVIDGYEAIVGCVSGLDPRMAHFGAIELIRSTEFANWFVHQERHKTFFYPTQPDKLAGLHNIGIEHISIAAGDDTTYDTSMLQAATTPMTLETADPAIQELTLSRSGFVAPGGSHLAAIKLLSAIDHSIALHARMA